MAYRNKTYIIFDASNDIKYYNLMKAWNDNESIDFNFYNAHDLFTVDKDKIDELIELDKKNGTKKEESYIKKQLKNRLNNTKQAIVLVGKSTKNLYKYVRWEIDIAIELKISIIAVFINGANEANIPPILRDSKLFKDSCDFKATEVQNKLDKLS